MKVFDVVDGEAQRSNGHTLKGYVIHKPFKYVPIFDAIFALPSYSHTGPVWQVAWAHPKFGQILASCSYDGKVIIWKEQQGQGPGAGGWSKIKEHTLHKASGACQ